MKTPRILNESPSFFGRVVGSIVAIATVGLLAGASCKKDSGTPKTNPKDVIAAVDAAKAGSGSGSAGSTSPIDRTPVAGFDVSKLESGKQDLFYQLIGALPSPCGKAHSLRTSLAQDAACKRAPYAVRLVHDLIVDEQGEDIVREIFDARYVKNTKVWDINIGDAPLVGTADAPVTLVEFFDYGCPACVQLKPVLDRVISENQGRLKVYYKMFPLVTKHPDSFGCAQAAMAALDQGKFHEMHDLLFEKYGNQKKTDLRKYAGDLGLDLGKYDAAVASNDARVKSDMKDGADVGVDGTPSLFLNGRLYGGPADPKYFSAAIDEEIAVRAASAVAPAPTPTPPVVVPAPAGK